MAKASPRSTTTTKANTASKRSTSRAAARAKPAATEPQGDDTHLMSADEETKMRETAVKPAAIKEGTKKGAKDPIAKYGDPDADPAETAVRRAVFG